MKVYRNRWSRVPEVVNSIMSFNLFRARSGQNLRQCNFGKFLGSGDERAQRIITDALKRADFGSAITLMIHDGSSGARTVGKMTGSITDSLSGNAVDSHLKLSIQQAFLGIPTKYPDFEKSVQAWISRNRRRLDWVFENLIYNCV